MDKKRIRADLHHVKKIHGIGFSTIPHGFQKRLWELKGIRLAVWLAHRLMEGNDRESYPSLETLAQYTGYAVKRITPARKWLRDNGWLVTTGQKHTPKGRFSVPTERTAIPTVATKCSHGDRRYKKRSPQNVVTAKCSTEVDPSLNLEVDTKAKTSEVGSVAQLKIVDDATLPAWVPLDAWNCYLEIRKPKATPSEIKLLLKELSQLKTNGDDPRAVIERSTVNRWKGFFPLSRNRNETRNRGGAVPPEPGKVYPKGRVIRNDSPKNPIPITEAEIFAHLKNAGKAKT